MCLHVLCLLPNSAPPCWLAQGTSADVLKLALLELHQKLTVAPYNCRLVLTVHDEVVMEVPLEHWPGVVKQITQIMEGVLPLMLKVDVQQGW